MAETSFRKPLLPRTMSFVSLRFTIKRDLFRLGPIWALLVGIVLADIGGVASAQNVALLILALILVDVIWGGLWEHMLVLARSAVPSYQSDSRPEGAASGPGIVTLPSLPYAQGTAPFTRLWSWLRAEEGRPGRDAGLGLAAILLALAGIIALMILVSGELPAGEAALAASIAVIVLALLGAILSPAFPGGAQLLGAAIGVGWPWLLGLNLLAWQAPAPFMWLLIAGFVLLAFVQEPGEGEAPSSVAALAGYGMVLAGLIWATGPSALLGTAQPEAVLVAWFPVLLAALVVSVPARRLLRRNTAGVARWHLLVLLVVTLSLLARSP